MPKTMATPPSPINSEIATKAKLPRTRILIITLSVMIVVGVGVFLLFTLLARTAPGRSAPAPKQTNQGAGTPVVAPVVQDSDRDGLVDSEEATIKTDPLNPDSDGDGLSDGEEVLIYHTDPLNPDSDGDTYHDGDEVHHGYNPNGPGRLSSPSNLP